MDFAETPREHFERLMAEGKIDEAERYIDALTMSVTLARRDAVKRLLDA